MPIEYAQLRLECLKIAAENTKAYPEVLKVAEELYQFVINNTKVC